MLGCVVVEEKAQKELAKQRAVIKRLTDLDSTCMAAVKESQRLRDEQLKIFRLDEDSEEFFVVPNSTPEATPEARESEPIIVREGNIYL